MPTSTEKVLREALVNPFEVPGESHVSEWFNYLASQFPLWTFQPWAYFEHQVEEVPRQYPIDVFVDSILGDDEIQLSELSPLEAVLMDRRKRLMDGLVQVETWSLEPVLRSDFIVDNWPAWMWTPSLRQHWGPVGLESEYAHVGRELMWHVEARERARASGDDGAKTKAEAGLNRFLAEIGVSNLQRRPPEGPSEKMLKALIAEGSQIIDICWAVFPVSASGRTRSTLSGSLGFQEADPLERDQPADAQTMDEVRLWSARLALPILSRPELLAVEDPSGKGRDILFKKRTRLKSRRLAIWFLARRLGMDASAISRKGVNARDSEKFKDIPNPVNAFVF